MFQHRNRAGRVAKVTASYRRKRGPVSGKKKYLEKRFVFYSAGRGQAGGAFSGFEYLTQAPNDLDVPLSLATAHVRSSVIVRNRGTWERDRGRSIQTSLGQCRCVKIAESLRAFEKRVACKGDN